MATYLLQVAYTSDGWKNQIQNPKSTIERVGPAVEKLGGKIKDLYYAFGDYDLIAIVDFPDNESAAAFSMAAAAGGAVKALKTTPLMSAEEGLAAMRKSGGAGYRPPGS